MSTHTRCPDETDDDRTERQLTWLAYRHGDARIRRLAVEQLAYRFDYSLEDDDLVPVEVSR